MTERRLTLVIAEGTIPDITLPGPPIHRLVAAIIEASRAWSAFASAAAEIIPDTEEGALRLALLDSVHDLEHAETNNGRIPQPGERPLFGGTA